MDLRSTVRRLYLRAVQPSRLSSDAAPFNFYLIHDDPHIVLVWTHSGLGHVREISRQLAPRPCHFLIGFWWDMAQKAKVDQFNIEWGKIQKQYPQNTLHVLCSSASEWRLFSKRTSIPAHFINQNCFLDEAIYHVREDVPKEFDALYNARMGTYKRLELAENIRSLAIITSPYEGSFRTNDPYYLAIRQRLAHAAWLNFDDREEYHRIPLSQICGHINRAKTGIILSAREGACYASGEYLLCGLPVVSTASRGGRDEMFTDATATIVADEPEAVAQGVQHWVSSAYDPHHVRKTTLETMWQHRRRFFEVVDGIRAAHGVREKLEDEWGQVFSNKMNYKCTPDDFLALSGIAAFREAVSEKERRILFGEGAGS